MTDSLGVAVIGAGIVGVSTALWLARDGQRVTLIDPVPPGDPDQASYGNAGLLARSSVVQIPTPGFLRHVPSMLMGRDGPLFMRWRHLPRLLPWLLPFVRSAREEKVRATASALAYLLGDAVEQHEALARGTGAERYLRRGDWTFLYPSRASFAKDAFGFGLRREHGFAWEERDRDALVERDPALGEAYGFGAAMTDHGWITDPGRYVAALAEEARRLGVEVVAEAAGGVTPHEGGATVALPSGARRFDRVVVSSGAWSRRIAEGLGHRVPLEAERGYHLVLKGAQVPPSPYMMADAKVAVTPMDGGLRLAGLVELASLDAPERDAPVALLRRRAKRLYPQLRWDAEESWMGRRPSTTDSLPMIGPSPKAPSVLLAFGAQHVGLTSGAKTGRLVADLVAGRRPNEDIAAFSPSRFD